MLKIYEFVIGILAVLGQGYVMYLTLKMAKFAKQYGRPWAKAWWVFFTAMGICWLRRVAVILWTSGIDGHFREAVVWYDRYVSNPVLTVLYLTFLFILVRWWKDFFTNLNGALKARENSVTKREVAVTARELLIERPNGVEVDKPKKVIVDVDGKKVIVDQPEKVVVVNPKKIEEVND